MSIPKFTLRLLFLVLVSVLAFTTAGNADKGNDKGSVPQRLRVRVADQRVRPGQTTKVTIEFLDRNYGQVVNDATREIVLDQVVPRSRKGTSGGGYFKEQKIIVRPGSWVGETWFTSNHSGRLFITATSEGLETGKALLLIASDKSASLLSRFFSLFETVAYAKDEELGFEIFPKIVTATADGRHRANFNVSFLSVPTAPMTVRIATNLTNGGILYKGVRVGGSTADIQVDAGQVTSDEISILSAGKGAFQITATVRPNGPVDQARAEFIAPHPTQIIFDADPTTIGSDATDVPLTVRLADDGGFPIEPDRPIPIRFCRATESDQVSFDPEAVVLGPGQGAAQVVMRLQQLPLGNELRLLAKSDQGLRIGQKSLVIKSAIEKLLITGPNEVFCGGEECEFIIYLGDKDGHHRAADWDRHIDLHVNGGVLDHAQLVIPRGERKAVVRYKPAKNIGKFVLSASSIGIADGNFPIGVIYQAYWLTIFALLGGLVGGIGRQLHADKSFTRILPHWTGKYWDMGCVGRLVGSLISALFLYWAFRLGLWPAFGSPALPPSLDLGTKIVAFIFGGFGGFLGTWVLELLTSWLVPAWKQKAAHAH